MYTSKRHYTYIVFVTTNNNKTFDCVRYLQERRSIL